MFLPPLKSICNLGFADFFGGLSPPPCEERKDGGHSEHCGLADPLQGSLRSPSPVPPPPGCWGDCFSPFLISSSASTSVPASSTLSELGTERKLSLRRDRRARQRQVVCVHSSAILQSVPGLGAWDGEGALRWISGAWRMPVRDPFCTERGERKCRGAGMSSPH